MNQKGSDAVKGLKWSKREQILGGCAAVFLLLLLVSYFHPFSEESDTGSLSWAELPKKTDESTDDSAEKADRTSEKPKAVVIDVKGAVKSPGVYQMKEGARIIDVIEKAGGFVEKADRKRINLAQLVEDEMVIYVPEIGEQGKNERTPIIGTGEKDGRIEINSADASELDKISGVGPATAKAIIAYRKKNGPFEKIEDLLKVSGIGESTLQKMKSQISLR